MKKRYLFINIGFLFLLILLVLRLGYWQIIKTADLSTTAKSQRLSSRKIPSLRGEIKSRDGFALATSLTQYKLLVDTRYFPKNQKDFAPLFPILGTSISANLIYKINDPKTVWFPLTDGINEEQKLQIERYKIPGLEWESGIARWYPEASISAHLLGFMGQDSEGNPKGYFGLEGFYNRELSGRPGKMVGEADVADRPILIDGQQIIPDFPGADLQTSIERPIQYLAYQKLKDGLDRYQAVSGTVTVMEPATGRILAMIALPDYDANKYQEYDDSLYRNPIIADAYEPGSTFKVIVMSAALDSQVLDENTKCTICMGPVVIGDAVIKTWNEKYYPNSSMTEVIQHSDNTGMVFVGRKLGKDKLLTYYDKFGLGHETGVDLQEETESRLRPAKDWYELDVAASTFGQGIAITPLQMLRAVSAIANKGVLVTPSIVDRVSGKPVTKKSGIQVISPLAAAKMAKMMINSVDRGEARWAKPAGFVIAGKTGTAQIPVSGHYDKTKTIVSFVGFAPADNPRFAMLVTLREPKTSPWGSETAAPLWFDLSRDIFRYFGLSPD